jgi:hypothetical protein
MVEVGNFERRVGLVKADYNYSGLHYWVGRLWVEAHQSNPLEECYHLGNNHSCYPAMLLDDQTFRPNCPSTRPDVAEDSALQSNSLAVADDSVYSHPEDCRPKHPQYHLLPTTV